METRGTRRSRIVIVAAVVVGAMVGVALDRAWTGRERVPSTSGERNGRVDSTEAPPASSPAVAPESSAAPSRARDALEAKRDDAQLPMADEFAELARLREKVRLLEAEVARLEAIVAANDPRTKRVREIFALNELRYGSLYREIAELAASDPESVAEDPRRMCDMLLRLVDGTGLIGVPPKDGQREIAPEPEAPETVVSLNFDSQPFTETVDDVKTEYPHEQAQVDLTLDLPKMPERWMGQHFRMHVHWVVDECANGSGFMMLSLEDPARTPVNGISGSITWGINWDARAAYVSRSPIRGGDEGINGGPNDFAAERRIVEELFEKLRARTRG
jgi:hypothetical protein